MNIEVIILIFTLAFLCEFIDSSMGMGYGTILSPLLIIIGIEPLVVIPSILISQSLSGISAGLFHNKYKNLNIKFGSKDFKVILTISIFGTFASGTAVFVAINIPAEILKIYIGLLIFIIGIILISKTRFVFSWGKIVAIALLSSFNKGISGGGFGPVITGGQIISGNGYKNSIGCTTICEGQICFTAFILYLIIRGIPDPYVVFPLIIGSVASTPFGPKITGKINPEKLKPLVGIIILLIGVLTIIKTIYNY
ncbi:sulfite exporter TauE/SafE family protein [candidate division KSB1 bacterium]